MTGGLRGAHGGRHDRAHRSVSGALCAFFGETGHGRACFTLWASFGLDRSANGVRNTDEYDIPSSLPSASVIVTADRLRWWAALSVGHSRR